MERVIDYLAEEEKREQQREAKRARMAKLVHDLSTNPLPSRPQPLPVDFLAEFGD